jgi:uncharacterized oxidoreductase
MGLQLARRLAEANTVVIAGRNETQLEEARAETPALRTLRLDVTSEADARDAIDWLSAQLDGLDLLVNNAGVMHAQPLSASQDPVASTQEVDVNLGGSVRMTRLALPLLHASSEAGVLFMSSAVALTAVPGFAVYAATKAAVHSLARSLRAELAEDGIRVFEVLPPWVDTKLDQHLDVPKVSPQVVVDAIVAGLARDRQQIPVGQIKQLAVLARLSPRLADRLMLRALPSP